MTVLAYAREHGLKPDTLDRWRRRLRSPVELPRLVPLTIETATPCEVAHGGASPSRYLFRQPWLYDDTYAVVTLPSWTPPVNEDCALCARQSKRRLSAWVRGLSAGAGR